MPRLNPLQSSRAETPRGASVGHSKTSRWRFGAICVALSASLAMAMPSRVANASPLTVTGDVLAVGIPAAGLWCAHSAGELSKASIRFGASLGTGLTTALALDWADPRGDGRSFPSGRSLSAFSGAQIVSQCAGPAYGALAYSLAGLASYAQIAEDRAFPHDVFGAIALNEIAYALFGSLSRAPKFQSDTPPEIARRPSGWAVTVLTGDSAMTAADWHFQANNGTASFTANNVRMMRTAASFPPAIEAYAEYWFNRNWGVSGGLSHRNYQAQTGSLSSELTALDLSAYLTTHVDALFRWPVSGSTDLEFGVGAGYALADSDIRTGDPTNATASGWGAVGPLVAVSGGVGYRLSDGFTLVSKYRFSHVWQAFSASPTSEITSNTWTATALIGIRYSFGLS